jgi:nuclear pore complex protein Nup155
MGQFLLIPSAPSLIPSYSEFDTFAEQPDTIISVTLVRPKSGVFVDDIKHIMVVCTTSSIILIGVGITFEPTGGDAVRKVLKLFATDMVLSTKNVAMSCIAGTDTGRIFMAGSDGHLYELDYASTESWFSAKTYLKNHSVSLMSSFLPSFMSAATEGMTIVST